VMDGIWGEMGVEVLGGGCLYVGGLDEDGE
jgi:hypothetical protein